MSLEISGSWNAEAFKVGLPWDVLAVTVVRDSEPSGRKRAIWGSSRKKAIWGQFFVMNLWIVAISEYVLGKYML